MMVKLKLQYFGHPMQRVDSLEKTLMRRNWGQEEKGTTENEMAGWHHWLNGRESEWTLGVGDGQGGLACYDSWGRKELDTTEQLNWSELIERCGQGLDRTTRNGAIPWGWVITMLLPGLNRGSSNQKLEGCPISCGLGSRIQPTCRDQEEVRGISSLSFSSVVCCQCLLSAIPKQEPRTKMSTGDCT